MVLALRAEFIARRAYNYSLTKPTIGDPFYMDVLASGVARIEVGIVHSDMQCTVLARVLITAGHVVQQRPHSTALPFAKRLLEVEAT